MIPKKYPEDYTLKFLGLLTILFYLASCVSGNQTVLSTPAGQGVTAPTAGQPSQTFSLGYPPPLPIPPNFAFVSPDCNSTICPNQIYPFDRSTTATLNVQISNPNNLPFTQQWVVNNVLKQESNNFVTTFPIDASDQAVFPSLGFYTIQSILLNSTGGVISSLVWSLEIVGTKASYASLNPIPSPDTYPNSPFSAADTSTKTISITFSNPSDTEFYNYWFLDGPQAGTPTDKTQLTVQFNFIPSNLGKGTHTVVSQLKDGNTASATILNSATWVFDINDLPQFSSFTGQQPSPATFPNIVFDNSVSLQPNQLYNPNNATFTINWELDGAVDSTATFQNYGPANNTPPPYVIDSSNINKFPLGRHSVVAVVYDEQNNIVDSANWNFQIVYPAPATLTYVGPDPASIDPNLLSLPADSSNTVIAVTTVPLNATITGFFQGPGTSISRGTPLVIGSTSFCVGVSDGSGLGAGYSASAGVQVQFSYANGGDINFIPLEFQDTPTPPPFVCLDGSGATTPTDGVPNFTLTALGDTYITAEVTDKLTFQTIANIRWNINVVSLNTPPEISIDPSSTQNNATLLQDTPATFTFIVEDKDCTPSGIANMECFGSQFELYSNPSTFVVGSGPFPQLVPLNGSNTYYNLGPATPTTPDCWRDFSYTLGDKFSCNLMIPSNDGSNPISASGTYEVRAIVNNLSIYPNGTPTYVGSSNFYNPIVPSNLLVWNIMVQEINTNGPTLINVISSGTATSSNSYAFLEGVPGIATNTFTENQSIQFNLNVNDPEKDNYQVKILYLPTSGTWTEAWSSTQTYSIADNPLITTPATLLPEDIVTGASAAVIQFNVQLTDVPDTASPITTNNYYNFNITNYNPPPDISTATFDPDYSATATVMQGFPYTFSIDQITDASLSDGNGLIWQWMINETQAECASDTASSWWDITGANNGSMPLPAPQVASLTWSPNYTGGIGISFCFRNCIGDDGTGNELNTGSCTATMAGPWMGPIVGISADTDNATTTIFQPDRPNTSMYLDSFYPAPGASIFGASVYQNSIYVVNYIYNQDTTITENFVQFATDSGDAYPSSTSTEGAYDIGITGNDEFIFVSYVFNKSNGYDGIPTLTVVKIPRSTFPSGTIEYLVADDVVSGIGRVAVRGLYFYVPYLRTAQNDVPYLFYGDATDTGFTQSSKANLGLGFSASQILSGVNRQFNRLYLVTKSKASGIVDLYSFDIPGDSSTPTFTTPVDEALNIFSTGIITDLAFAVGAVALGYNNPFVYIAGKNITNGQIYYRRFDYLDFDNAPFESIPPSPYPNQAFEVLGINAVPSPNSGELILGVIKNEANPTTSTNSYLLKMNESEIQVSSKINQVPSTPSLLSMIDSYDFAITGVYPGFVIGDAGAVADENKKDTLWFRYYDSSSERNVIVNIQEETFSNSTPTANEPWSVPWFSSP